MSEMNMGNFENIVSGMNTAMRQTIFKPLHKNKKIRQAILDGQLLTGECILAELCLDEGPKWDEKIERMKSVHELHSDMLTRQYELDDGTLILKDETKRYYERAK